MDFDITRRIGMPLPPEYSYTELLARYRLWLYGAAGVAALCLVFLLWLLSPPGNFPTNSITTITASSSAADFSHELAQAGIIRSPKAFHVLARISGLDHSLDDGAYVFEGPAWLPLVLWRIGNGEHGIEPVRVTITEGMTQYDIADTFAETLPGFTKEAFLTEASTSEGYLFPETYLFMPGTEAREIVVRLKSQFSQSIEPITTEILTYKRKFSDVVILASILEREANNPEDMRMVAGILWNRIDKGMPLQVDAAFGYIHKENGYTPTAADLESDSPYNTYRNKGLPPTPISNPGLDAILAAVTPEDTDYFYYLTGRDGKMYYGTTFEDHKKNRALYLD